MCKALIFPTTVFNWSASTNDLRMCSSYAVTACSLLTTYLMPSQCNGVGKSHGGDRSPQRTSTLQQPLVGDLQILCCDENTSKHVLWTKELQTGECKGGEMELVE